MSRVSVLTLNEYLISDLTVFVMKTCFSLQIGQTRMLTAARVNQLTVVSLGGKWTCRDLFAMLTQRLITAHSHKHVVMA